ncbi:hypothetical protein Pcinc_004902 [Petrolisthes cinctipes]|uniref:MRH domain-containing protein n=1 Tax=Petrolisthes cinctipes TaxID=88211 RepID=A0AAE1GKG9_PETCI|nr:hypothetical protein Pcinc_004902 [Petrolisthes cinctipes]
MVAQRGKTKYNFKFCGNVMDSRPNVTLVQSENSKPISLGLSNRTVVRSEEYWMMLTFLGGDNFTNECGNESRKAHVLIICDHKKKTPSMSVMNDDLGTMNCSPSFIVRHRVVCTQKGLGGWTIFFIIVMVTFGGYFIFGFLYLRLVKGAKGVEQIPNRTFWFRVGNMMADGCGAVFRCDRYCGGGEAGVGGAPTTSSSYSGYSPIEDRLVQDLQEPDRDSALLSP